MTEPGENQFYVEAPGWVDEHGRVRLDPRPESKGMDWLDAIRDQLNRIEARQRDYGMHDPDCRVRGEEKHLAKHPDNWPTIPTPECTCWLSR